MTLNRHAKFKEKLSCDLINDLRNLVNFHASCRGNLLFDGLLCPKHIKI